MHDNALTGTTSLLEEVPCAIVPAQFVRSWRQWILRPGEVSRPPSVENSQFLCEHCMLAFDPNISGDIDTTMAIIKRTDWDALVELYGGGPLIALEKIGDRFVHELDVCAGCRVKR